MNKYIALITAAVLGTAAQAAAQEPQASIDSAVSAALTAPAAAAQQPGMREFRGAWMHTIFQDQYRKLGTEQLQTYLRQQLDQLQRAGVNAVFFQVRPQADAFYHSRLEPWSRFITDNGRAPQPNWDPLQFMVAECHKRGMELHAWLNPYRVTSAAAQKLPPGHLALRQPDRFIRYEGKLYFDPARPENIDHIGDVVEDIIKRYDVDGIHFDDYFYPYPGKGEFDDSKSYAKYGRGMDRGDWRRKNVDQLIESVAKRIRRSRPWVRFGISPFGIYRNAKTDPKGSQTSGLQNYDDLYADVLLWAREGWIDYLLPQLYWEVGHKRADYAALLPWWAANVPESCQLYIGQDVKRSMDFADSTAVRQLNTKIQMERALAAVDGLCWWPAYEVTANYKGAADAIADTLCATRALVPAYPALSDRAPRIPTGVTTEGGNLSWKAPDRYLKPTDVTHWAVYRFDEGQPVDLGNPGALVAVTYEPHYDVAVRGTYVITALDRVNNQSQPSKPVTVIPKNKQHPRRK